MGEYVNRIKCRLREIKWLIGRKPRRLLFEHIPKTAGTAVVSFLTSNYPHKLIFGIDGKHGRDCIKRFREMPKAQRLGYHLIYGHAAHELRSLVHPDTICTTILRDPVDRLVSLYYFVKESPGHYLYEQVKSRNLDFGGFLESGLTPETRNDMVRRLTGISWQDAEADPDGALERALEVLETEYPVVGTMDDLQGWASRLGPLVGLSSRFPSRKVNQTKNRKPIAKIDTETLSLLRRLNHLDIELYRRVCLHNQKVSSVAEGE